uniref:Uncharacterized protein n=1 Tax=Rhabditophanes sp. KR3021 TaxID=114890 RepID=A0AC35UI32_9BILA
MFSYLFFVWSYIIVPGFIVLPGLCLFTQCGKKGEQIGVYNEQDAKIAQKILATKSKKVRTSKELLLDRDVVKPEVVKDSCDDHGKYSKAKKMLKPKNLTAPNQLGNSVVKNDESTRKLKEQFTKAEIKPPTTMNLLQCIL